VKRVTLVVIAAVVLGAGAVSLAAALQPDHFAIERRRELDADVATLSRHLVDFHEWEAWSPWDAMDPDMTKQYSDPPYGAGAWYSWSGNEQVGKGKMSITKIEPHRVTYRLQFIEPFESEAVTIFEMNPKGAKTELVWRIEGENGFVEKLLGLFMSFDAMIGKDFEAGFDNLERRLQER
jgi:hypothetical protein